MEFVLSIIGTISTRPWLRVFSSIVTDLIILWLIASLKALAGFQVISLIFDVIVSTVLLLSAVRIEAILESSSS